MSDKDRYEDERLTLAPNIDLVEKVDNWLVIADVPGADEKSVEITLEGDNLTLAATAEAKKTDYRRTFTLSNKVSRDNIHASVKNGVLTIDIAKAQEAKPRKIEITH